MKNTYILALDQGTSSSRAIVFDREGSIQFVSQQEFTQYFPSPGWVEHDAQEIWESERAVMRKAVEAMGNDAKIAAIGIANQRETTIIWDARTGEPICKAIVWQDRRTADYCEQLRSEGWAERIQQKTGLIVDAYFSATKICWMLENVKGAKERAQRGELRFGTVDSWLVWNLTEGRCHVTDVTNASRTMLFNIHTMQWDDELLELMGIPASMMPEVRSCSEKYGQTPCLKGLGTGNDTVEVAGIMGDQQAALFGQMCIHPGDVKNTYGTGCFLLMNIGEKPILSNSNLLTTVAWKIGSQVNYALEGSIFVAGSVVQWLRDGLGIIRSSQEVEALAASVPDNGGVYFVPALTGLGAPYWDAYAQGSINGITRGTKAGHIARAALEGIAFQTMDIVEAMEHDSGIAIETLKVDGGASRNNLLMQFQSDILDVSVTRPRFTETTALGAAYMAGLAVGYWDSLEDISDHWQAERQFTPSMSQEQQEDARHRWHDAVSRTLSRTTAR